VTHATGKDRLKVRGVEKVKTTSSLLEDRYPLFGIMLQQTVPRVCRKNAAGAAIVRKWRRLSVSICGACGTRMGQA
jgi:hypothetical protein